MREETQQKLRAWLEYTDNIIGLLSTYSTLNDKILIDVGAHQLVGSASEVLSLSAQLACTSSVERPARLTK